MYVGRILQGVAGTGAWIVGFAMITDAAGSKHLGKALGFSGSFITAGIITGPAVAGVMLELLGYWPAWSVPLVLLVICFIARLAMVEVPKTSKAVSEDVAQNENASLLDAEQSGATEGSETKMRTGLGFWGIMFRQGSVYAAIFNVTGKSAGYNM